MVMSVDRDCFVGSYVSEAVKEALQEEAHKQGLSLSLLVFNLLKEAMRVEGYEVDRQLWLERMRPLPFEEPAPK